MKNFIRISIFLLLLAWPISADWPKPVVALKTLSNGNFYVPNAMLIDPTGKTHIYYLKVDLWCNMSDIDCSSGICGCTRMEADQGGGTNPYYNLSTTPPFWINANWPDGVVDMRDASVFSLSYGMVEGGSKWNYMADCYPDRVISDSDLNLATAHFGQHGTYSNDSANIYVSFTTGQNIYPNSEGYFSVFPGQTNFTVYKGAKPVMALVTFYNTTSPAPPNFINSVTLNSPQSDPMLYIGDTFVVNCTPSTDDSLYGINVAFEYNYSGNPNFVSIPTSGSLLIANDTEQKNVRNGVSYARRITVVGENNYYVRCKLYNATSSVNSTSQKVTAKGPAQIHLTDFRIYQSSDMTQLGVGNLICNDYSWTPWFSSMFENWTCSKLALNTPYRVEIRVCNDAIFGKDANLTAVVHGNLTSNYIGAMGSCATGDGSLTPISCNWNSSERNGVYMDASGVILAGGGTNQTRNDSTCQWFAYNFTVAPLRSDSSFVSNISTRGVNPGNNTAINNMTLSLSAQSLVISDFNIYRSSNITQLGVGDRVCNFSSSYGSSMPDSICMNKLLSMTQYRAEIRICNDRYPAFDVNLTSVVHSNLSLDYASSLGSCATGDGSLTPISCSWNATDRGVYMVATNVNLSGGTARNDSTCQWFAYTFTTGPLRNDSSVNSSISVRGVNYGSSPVVNNITINMTPQYAMSNVTLVLPNSNVTLVDGANFTISCIPYTGGGYGINVTFEYNSTGNQTWRTIPNATGSFWIYGNNVEVEVSNGGTYTHTITGNAYGTYAVRCRMSNATSSVYSGIRKVDVYPGYLNVAVSPSPAVYNSSNPLVIGQYNPLAVNASVKCSSLGFTGECGNVTCSIRYNKSSLTPDSFISEIQGSKPFYIMSAGMTHDFNGVSNPSMTHQAVGGVAVDDFPSGISTSGEATNLPYSQIASEDGSDWIISFIAPWWNYNISAYHQFRFQLNESIDSIKKIRIYYKGWTSTNKSVSSKCDTPSYLTSMYVWNYTASSWKYLGNHSSPFDDVISAELASGFANVVSSNYIYILVIGDFGDIKCRTNISTDFVKLDVDISNKTILPCGRMMSNQSCNFTWLINASGVNELRDIDVNCSTSKTTVNASESGDSYIYLKGVEVHTDKSSYRSCGAVYYKVRVYDFNNNLRDDNLTIRLYDPSGSMVNENKVQTSGGVYNDSYVLPSGVQLGEWVIRSFSCVVSNKTFAVGNGNGADFWKLEWQMPNKVRFSPSERIPIFVKFYNQIGEGAGVFGPWGYVDSSSMNCPRVTGMTGMYDCSITAPSTTGAHYINIYGMAGGRMFNETRYFYVGG